MDVTANLDQRLCMAGGGCDAGPDQGPVKVALCRECDVSQAAHGPTLPAEVAGRRAEAPFQLVGRNGHLATLPRPWGRIKRVLASERHLRK